MRTSIILQAAVVGLALAPAAPAQSPLDTRVDSLVQAEMQRRLIPGAAVVVVRDGVVLKKQGYGLASVELSVPATTSTLFQIASATKNVTGVAIMQLVEGGKFRLDDRVTTLLSGLPASWAPVTVRQLLSHTSGLPDLIVDAETGVWLPGGRDSVIAQLSRMPSKPAGKAWSYNQTNYLLLGELIDKYGGLPYRDYFRQRVLAPLGIQGVVFGDSKSVVRGRTSEYTRLGIPKEAKELADLKAFSYYYPDGLYTAAGIFMHADDMARWMIGVQRGVGLSPASFREMTTTVSIDGTPFHMDGDVGYGLGWIALDRAENRAIGGSGGGRTAIFFYPDRRLAVAVMTNLQGAGPESLVEMIADLYPKGR